MPSRNAGIPDRLSLALERIDAANAEDRERVEVEAESLPAALLYGRRMSARLDCFFPHADEALRLAARAQHIRRFAHPRTDYPDGREGYLRWRVALGRFHAAEATRIMVSVGYDEATCGRVRRMLEKRARRSDADVQRLEDVACLVFLEHYAEPFARKHAAEKVVRILKKTWAKMSPEAQVAAQALALSAPVRGLLEEALAG